MQIFNIVISIILIIIILMLLLLEKIKKFEPKKINLDDFVEKHFNKIILVLFILIGISRLYEFGSLPKAIGVDEAGSAYDAYCLAEYGTDRYLNSFPVYLVNFGGGQSALYAYLNTLLIKILGQSNILISRLPELLTFLMAIFLSYKLVRKKQDKKTALLFTFLIVICPWHIIQSRYGLDCNLLGPLFILDLYLLENAKRNYQYFLAGICIGITLYTYSVSYLIMPVFLLSWTIYHLYTKKITIKQVLIIALAVFIFAIPLMYFLLVNFGVFDKTNFGIFTVPKLFEFRSGEIAIQNILLLGSKSLKNIFLGENTIYYLEIPFFIIGIIRGIRNAMQTMRKKEYSFLTLMTITFFSILVPNLMVYIATTNKANILYLPILYFTTIGILYTIENRKILWIFLILAYFILFITFEVYYYSDYALKEHSAYEDVGINKVMEYIEQNDIEYETMNMIALNKAEPYIYIVLSKKISPIIFNNTRKTTILHDTATFTEKILNINFTNTKDFDKYDENKIFIINDKYKELNEKFAELNYKTIKIENYYLYTTK